jgi:DNA-binding IscR family transcriptional regulator
MAGCDTVEEIARLGRGYFQSLSNLGGKSLQQLADLTGWPPKRRMAVDTIATALGVDPQEARETASDVLTPLRKAGLVLAVSNRARA